MDVANIAPVATPDDIPIKVLIPAFIISLSIGIFLVYIGSPRPYIIYFYPNPDNLHKMQYKDKSGACFGFDAEQVTCPTRDDLIRKYPIQEGQKAKK
jgi:hypothetical protein